MEKLLFVLFAVCCACAAQNENKFEVTRGCRQYNSNSGYKSAHPYFSTAMFRYKKINSNVMTVRVGVLARNDGIIRLSPVEYPYDSTDMNEIVVSGFANTRSEGRRYTRVDYQTVTNNTVLKGQSSYGMLSEFSPLMFTIEFHPNGIVKLIKDSDVLPFFEFQDAKLSFKYVGFSGWDVPVIYFYDCPL